MSLREYQEKRSFYSTSEPKGTRKATTGPLTFVIQKHEASHLHYDFRLELNGVLKSWAIPKGPSLNPRDKRLAVIVEDHPLEYAKFEGIIPKGNYGAGNVMVWDKGVYSPIAFVDRLQGEVLINEQLDKGHLTFILLGEKLKGEFALVKTHRGEENAWLLIKKSDEYASKKDVLLKDHSVLTGRSMEEIKNQAIEKKEVWISKPKNLKIDDAPEGYMPHIVKPMLAQNIDEPFDNDDWIFEIKYDGYRAIAQVESRNVKLYSRNNISYNEKFAPIVESLKKFPEDVVLDGEIVVVDKNGHPKFQWLQDYPGEKNGELIYFVFDILYYSGHVLKSLPLSRRKEILRKILPPLSGIQYCEHIEGRGIEMFHLVQKLGLEGIIAKNSESAYAPGTRTKNWLKIKLQNHQEVFIAGFTKPKGGRKYFGALIAGIYKNKKLLYVGHVGGGFDDKDLKDIHEAMLPYVQDACPFDMVPVTNAPVTWTRPKLIADVAFSNLTTDSQMRHPVFLELKNDTTPLRLTNLSKVFWPEEKYTKGDLINYYREISGIILPHLKDRPESLLRYPNGIKGKSFYQKDASTLSADFIEKTTVHSDSNNKYIEYLLCQNEKSLMYIINLGCIDLNPWSSRVGHLEMADYLIIDLDPEAIDFINVVKVALEIRKLLEKLDIVSFVKTSGAKGMHIYIPLGAKYTYEQSRKLAELLCIQVHKKIPKITSLIRDPRKRQGLVYLDFLQNIKGQTLASPYSVRAQKDATVSTPILWSEVTNKLHPSQFNIKNIPARIQKHGDLFKGVLGKGIDMEKVLDKINV